MLVTSQTNIIVVEINFVISLLLVTNCVCASSISAFIIQHQPINFNLITRPNISELWFNNEVWIPSRSLGKSSDHICPCAPEITQSQGPHRKMETSNRSEFLWFHYGFQYEVAKHLTLRACPVITYCDVVIMVVSRVSHKTVTHSPFLWYQVQAVPVQYYKLSTMWKFTIFQSLQFSNPVTHQPDGNAKSRTELNYVSLSSCDFIS